jgi:hypothetical protein
MENQYMYGERAKAMAGNNNSKYMVNVLAGVYNN